MGNILSEAMRQLSVTPSKSLAAFSTPNSGFPRKSCKSSINTLSAKLQLSRSSIAGPDNCIPFVYLTISSCASAFQCGLALFDRDRP